MKDKWLYQNPVAKQRIAAGDKDKKYIKLCQEQRLTFTEAQISGNDQYHLFCVMLLLMIKYI